MKNLTENQQQLIDNLVSEFTQMNKPKGSSNNPFDAIFEESQEDKRQKDELDKLAEVKTKALSAEALERLKRIEGYLDELGFGEFTEIISGTGGLTIAKLELSVEKETSLTIYAFMECKSISIGRYHSHTNHRISYGISATYNSTRWSDIDSLLNDSHFKTLLKDFFKRVDKFTEYSTK